RGGRRRSALYNEANRVCRPMYDHGGLMSHTFCSAVHRAWTVASLLLAIGAPASSQEPVDASQALAAYVAEPDPSFAWELRRRYRHRDAEILEFRLASQTWQGELWKHQLLL